MDAKEILTNAVRCDHNGRILEAQNLFHTGIQLLMDIVKNESNELKKRVYYERIQEYIERAEEIQERIDKHMIHGALVERKTINDGEIGHSYESLFAKYLKDDVIEVLLEEPYLHEKYHFQNLIVFLELIVQRCDNLRFVRIVTKPDRKAASNQSLILKRQQDELKSKNINVILRYEETLHDRKIVLGNGYIIKFGRGLHFYKVDNPNVFLGHIDYDFRKCLQTEMDIWRVKI